MYNYLMPENKEKKPNPEDVLKRMLNTPPVKGKDKKKKK